MFEPIPFGYEPLASSYTLWPSHDEIKTTHPVEIMVNAIISWLSHNPNTKKLEWKGSIMNEYSKLMLHYNFTDAELQDIGNQVRERLSNTVKSEFIPAKGFFGSRNLILTRI